MFAARAFLTLACIVAPALGATYGLVDNFVGSSFLSGFQHQAIGDPTHGRVNYVDQGTAIAKNLTYASGDTFIIRADHTTVLTPSGPGRNSVRLMSNKQYTRHVAVFNIRHMPQGCSTWPAVWEVGDNWPNGGEIDILEGVNDVSPNQATLHTGAGCTMPASRAQTGHITGNDCNVYTTNNAGCGVQAPTPPSYGAAFNNAGGGWYAVERTDTFIKVWFWNREVPGTPGDVANGAGSVNTDNWGQPFAYFPNTSCDFPSHFAPMNIIINLTLCGDWAGAVFNADGCPGDCVSYVNNNPSAFSNAYFDFASVKVYQ
ncbi:laminarinase [Lentinus brumalis]|uniref:Laminarinase n=1 Tax=Lentinus brumalis TaxID=2498619 RepID=A0A371CX09_9APHY|nr:laminarinase [Polyporus brumalis]